VRERQHLLVARARTRERSAGGRQESLSWRPSADQTTRRVSPGDRPLTKQPEDTGYEIAHAVCLLALDDIMKKRVSVKRQYFSKILGYP